MSNEKTGDAQAIIEAVRKTTEPKTILVPFEGIDEAVIITSNASGETCLTTARDLFADRAAAPQRRKGTIVVHDLATFIEATNRDSDVCSVVFADVPGRKLTAVLDFHGYGGGTARWCQNRIEYGFTLSPQLKAWLEAARAPMDQKTFSALIDNRLGDIGDMDPEPGSIAHEFAKRRGIRFATIADLLMFTRTIATKSTTESEEQIDENTGDVSIQYKKRGDVKTPDGKPIPVPPAFVLKIPILCGIGATEFTIAVRLRYDIGEKGITWRIEINALDQYILAAVGEAVDVVRGPKVAPKDGVPVGCGLPVFMGVAPA